MISEQTTESRLVTQLLKRSSIVDDRAHTKNLAGIYSSREFAANSLGVVVLEVFVADVVTLPVSDQDPAPPSAICSMLQSFACMS